MAGKINQLEEMLNSEIFGTERIRVLINLGIELRHTQPARLVEIAKQLEVLSTQQSSPLAFAYHILFIGISHFWKSDFNLAIDLSRKSQQLFAELNDKDGEAIALNNIGNALYRLGDYQNAFDVFNQSLTIATETFNLSLQAAVLNGIGNAYRTLGNYPLALKSHHKSLELKKSLGDVWGEATSWTNLANVYSVMGQQLKAIDAFQLALNLFTQYGDEKTTTVTLLNLGSAYYRIKDYVSANDYFFKSLMVARKFTDKFTEAAAVVNIGLVYSFQGDFTNALKYCFMSLEINQGISDKRGEAQSLSSIATIYTKLKMQERAILYYEKSQGASHEIGDAFNEASVLMSMAQAFESLNKRQEAISKLHESLALATKIENDRLLISLYELLSNLYRRTGNVAQSRHYHALFTDCKTRMASQTDASQVKRQLVNTELGKVETFMRTLSDAEQQELSLAIEATIAERASDLLSNSRSKHKTPISVVTFGTFAVSIGSRELQDADWERKKSRDVFKVLLLHHQKAVATDELRELLWPDADGKRFESSLMKAVSHIRKALEPDLEAYKPSAYLKTTDRTYTLDLGDDAFIDFVMFKQHISEARHAATPEDKRRCYEKAIDLYSGDFLKENLYEEWSAFERETLKEAYLEALGFVSDHYRRSANWDAAIQTAEKILQTDRTTEKAYEILFTALFNKQQPAELRRAYDRCKAAFEKDLGTPPPKKLQMVFSSLV
jgi:two-component SAPR family response regulator/Tfp pilus assembly protein PilF